MARLIDMLKNALDMTRPKPWHQQKGPIRKEKRAMMVCPFCTIQARLENPFARLQGVDKQHFATHLVAYHGIAADKAAGIREDILS